MAKLIPKYQKGKNIEHVKNKVTNVWVTKKAEENQPISNLVASAPNLTGISKNYIYNFIPGSELNVLNLDKRVDKNNMVSFYLALKRNKELNKYQKAAIFANVGAESFFNPMQQQIGGPAYGIMQFESDRQIDYKNHITPHIKDNKINYDIVVDYLVDTTYRKPDTKLHWNKGSKYNNAIEGYEKFKNAKDLQTAVEAIYYGYVRPKSSQQPTIKDKELKKRIETALQVVHNF